MPDHRDSLEEIRVQVEAAHESAERLMGEAREQAGPPPDDDPDPLRRARAAEEAARAAFEDVPPAGWASEEDERARDRRSSDELRAIAALLELARDGMRGSVPPELRETLVDAVRRLLQALRALIDWYLERLDRPARGAVEVEDIPIDRPGEPT